MKLNVIVLLVCASAFLICDSAKILGIVPTPSYSHQVFFQPIWKELSLRGHQVTVLTTDPMKDQSLTNLTEIDLSFSYKPYNERLAKLINPEQKISFEAMKTMTTMWDDILEFQLNHPEVQNLLNNKTEHFDLLMVEFQLLPMIGFAHRFKCPYIGILSYPGTSFSYQYIGSPTHPVLYPDFFFSTGKKTQFFDRVAALAFYVIANLFSELLALPGQRAVLKKHFGEDVPSLEKLATSIDMFFVNSDPIFGTIRPLVPGIIQIGGGAHRKAPKPLPKELKTILDNAKNGFIYFSLGSNMKSEFLTEEMRKAILETFAELPYTILWKFELDTLEGKPKNVHISKWLPQQDILKHPNIKLFITQGGLQSLDEAIYENVPIVGLPFFADQPINIKNIVVGKGIGVSVEPMVLTKESFKNAILEVLHNPKYKLRITELANLARDVPMNGLEKAIWWTEYVLRHKGAKHFRSPSLDLPSYQFYLLDVIGFLVAVSAIVLYLTVKCVKLSFRAIKFLLFKTKRKVE